MRRQLIGLLVLVLVSGCSGMSATQLGHTVGTIAGSALAPGVGAPVGALVGLMTGMLVQGQVDKATEHRERQTLSEQMSSRVPGAPRAALATGDSVRVWVDETVREGRVLAGHFDVRYLP